MAVLITVLVLLLLALVVFVVSGPLRDAARVRGERGSDEGEEAGAEALAGTGEEEEAEQERLEAAREAKYREIRDAELDYRTGKLSEQDYRRLDAELRAEALAILDALEAAGVRPTDASEG